VEWGSQRQEPGSGEVPDKEVKSESQEPEVKHQRLADDNQEIREAQEALDVEGVRQAWPKLMQAVKPHNHSLEALLRAVEPVRCEARTLVLKVFYNFHKEQLEQERYRQILEKVFATELGGGVVRLEFELGNKSVLSQERVEVVNVTGKVEDEDLAQAAEKIFGG